MAVVAELSLGGELRLSQLRQALARAEATVGLPLLDKSLGVLAIEVGALTLAIGPAGTADVRPLVPFETDPLEGAQDGLF